MFPRVFICVVFTSLLPLPHLSDSLVHKQDAQHSTTITVPVKYILSYHLSPPPCLSVLQSGTGKYGSTCGSTVLVLCAWGCCQSRLSGLRSPLVSTQRTSACPSSHSWSMRGTSLATTLPWRYVVGCLYGYPSCRRGPYGSARFITL